ncbi:MAG: sigma-70 family RNA polymerase sigma factor [Bacteroidetes bacterium]|nr:sigma-70 family RNA polymerase sigma factor [Bacteroidota bacterium]
MFSAKMFAVCYEYSSSREEAEDTFHEGFLKVFDHINSYSKIGSLEGWIRKIMVNTAIEKYRKNSRLFAVVNIDDHIESLHNYYEEDILSQIEANELMELIHQLPPAYKMVFNLYVFEGLKHKEIAAQLDINIGTSKSNLFEAKSILKKKILKLNEITSISEQHHGR